MEKEENSSLGHRLNMILHDKKGENLNQVIEKALADKDILSEVLRGQISKDETCRYNCFKVLYQISESHPAVVYPKWDEITGLLESENSYHRMAAVHLLSNLTVVDTEKKFDTIFDRFFLLLDDPSMIVARYLAGNAGKIVRAKPEFQYQITKKLLAIDATHHREDRKDLIKHDIIQSFIEFYENIPDKDEVMTFVRNQQNSSSPKTRKITRDFLKRFSE